MADEAPAVNEPVAPQDTTPTDSAPVETNSPEVAGDGQAEADKAVADSLAQETETEDKAEAGDDKPTDQAESEETKEPEQPQGKAEERKAQLNNEIRDLVSKRNALRQDVEKANAEVYQPATEQELQDQGLSPEMAAIEAMKQEREIERYNTQVAEAQLTLATEAQTALKDFPMFDKDSPDYKPALAAKIDPILGQNLIFDQNTGQVIGSHVSPYALYQAFAEATQASAQEGQVKGQQATEQMLARADSPTSAAPAKESENDAFMKGLLGER